MKESLSHQLLLGPKNLTREQRPNMTMGLDLLMHGANKEERSCLTTSGITKLPF